MAQRTTSKDSWKFAVAGLFFMMGGAFALIHGGNSVLMRPISPEAADLINGGNVATCIWHKQQLVCDDEYTYCGKTTKWGAGSYGEGGSKKLQTDAYCHDIIDDRCKCKIADIDKPCYKYVVEDVVIP